MEKGLSIIFPSFNSGSLLIRCLKAVELELEDQKNQYEILIVDSSPISPELPSINNLKLFHSNVQLFASEARNLGARMAKHPILVFIDSDVELLSGSLSKLLGCLKGNVTVVAGVYEVHNPHTSPISTFQDLFLLYRYENIPPAKNFFSSAQFAVSKESFLRVGGFSENLQSYEDLDLSFKFQKNYLKAHVCLESRGYHLKSFSLKSIFLDYYLKSRNMIYYRLSRLNDLHWCDTFLPSRLGVSYYFVFCYMFLFAMIAIESGPLPLSVEIFVLALFLVLDIGLLADFLRFIWKETRSPISVLRSFLFFKATTVPIILGTLIGFYKFIRKDVSLLNKIKAAPDIVDTNITYHPKK
jgi:GT2 family glycosyltransferase